MSGPGYLLTAVAARTGEVRDFPLSENDRRALLESARRSEGRLVAIWTQTGGPTRFVVRAGSGPWPPPADGLPPGPRRWAAADAAAFDGRVRYRVITENPWKTVEEGFLQPDRLDPDAR